MTQPEVRLSSKALGGAIAGLFEAPAQVATAMAGLLTQRTSSSCEIPPPCWEPKPAGTCRVELTPASSATIRVHLSNCGWSRQVVTLTALGKLAGWLTFSPTTLVLDPQELVTILVRVHVPDKAAIGQRFAAPVIIRGCRDHYVRLEVHVSDCVGQNCCDVAVDDCADNIHHWYDHFYCARPCRNVRDPAGGGVTHG